MSTDRLPMVRMKYSGPDNNICIQPNITDCVDSLALYYDDHSYYEKNNGDCGGTSGPLDWDRPPSSITNQETDLRLNLGDHNESTTGKGIRRLSEDEEPTYKK
ncbi:MAG: hypothetical protein Q9188_006999 [Gyalolechia gomerana]